MLKLWKRKRSTKPFEWQGKIPLSVEEPDAWTIGDASTLNAFIRGSVGQKLLARMYHEMYSEMLAGERRDDYTQGMLDGKNRRIAELLMLSDLDYWNTIESDNKSMFGDNK